MNLIQLSLHIVMIFSASYLLSLSYYLFYDWDKYLLIELTERLGSAIALFGISAPIALLYFGMQKFRMDKARTFMQVWYCSLIFFFILTAAGWYMS